MLIEPSSELWMEKSKAFDAKIVQCFAEAYIVEEGARKCSGNIMPMSDPSWDQEVPIAPGSKGNLIIEIQ